MKTKMMLTGLALGILCTQSLMAQSPLPFSTAVRNYAYIGKAGLNADPNQVMLFTSTDPAAGNGGFGTGIPVTYTNQVAQSINGAGICNTDGLIYGLEYAYAGPNSANGTLYRVGANGVSQQVGVIAAPTSTDAGRPITSSYVNTAAGTMDNAGTLWFTAFTFTDINPPLSSGKVDVFLGRVPNPSSLAAGANNITPTYYHLDISDPVLQQGYANFMSSLFAHVVNGMNLSDVSGGFQDMDLNPADGKFYSYIAFPSAPTSPAPPIVEPPLNSHLVRIDVVNSGGYWGKVSLINTTPNTTPGYEEDGAYFDAAGNYYALFTNGEYAQVDLATGALGTLTPSGLPLSASSGQMRGDLATNSPVVPLPVKLLSFDATAGKRTNALGWKIADWQELNNVQIERSADGKSFSQLAVMTQKEQQGSFTDNEPLSVSYYRLRMNSQSGQALYSQVVRVAAYREGAVSVSPNPASDHITISTQPEAITATLTDLSGRTVQVSAFSAGAELKKMDISALAPGIYQLSLTGTDGQKRLSTLINKQ